MSHIKAHYAIRELPATHSLIVYIGTRLTAGTSQIKKPEKRGGEGGIAFTYNSCTPLWAEYCRSPDADRAGSRA